MNISGAIKMKRNVAGVVSALTRKQLRKIVVQSGFNQVDCQEIRHNFTHNSSVTKYDSLKIQIRMGWVWGELQRFQMQVWSGFTIFSSK